MAYISDDELMEQALANQIAEAPEQKPQANTKEEVNEDVPEQVTKEQQIEEPKSEASQYIGKKIGHIPGESPFKDKEKDNRLIEEKKLSRVGDKIDTTISIREGWMDVDKALLGQRAIFYPEDWEFRIRPATVEAIRNWSNIDDEQPTVVDEVFNEIIKSCLSIVGPGGRPIPWGNINSWDRFFFLLLIREYTFRQGEKKIKYTDYCPECDNEIDFELTSQSLMYDYPDESVMKYYSQEDKTWYIDPTEFGFENEDPIQLYIPTLDKDAALRDWLIATLQENRNRKIDQTFIRFCNWLTPKLSKDQNIIKKQIRELELKYKSWDAEMFSFMDSVIRNIIVTPQNTLVVKCPICGEEVTSTLRFPNSIKELFTIETGFKKFGTK